MQAVVWYSDAVTWSEEVFESQGSSFTPIVKENVTTWIYPNLVQI